MTALNFCGEVCARCSPSCLINDRSFCFVFNQKLLFLLVCFSVDTIDMKRLCAQWTSMKGPVIHTGQVDGVREKPPNTHFLTFASLHWRLLAADRPVNLLLIRPPKHHTTEWATYHPNGPQCGVHEFKLDVYMSFYGWAWGLRKAWTVNCKMWCIYTVSSDSHSCDLLYIFLWSIVLILLLNMQWLI